MIYVDQTLKETKQKTFTKIVNHLRKQNCKSINNKNICLYRGPNSTMCAAGCLIPDSLYDQDLENRSVINDITLTKVGELILKLNYCPIIASKLQGVHDNYNIDSWEEHFSMIAEIYYLKLEEINNG